MIDYMVIGTTAFMAGFGLGSLITGHLKNEQRRHLASSLVTALASRIEDGWGRSEIKTGIVRYLDMASDHIAEGKVVPLPRRPDV